MEYNRQAHAVYHTRYHLIFATKYRRKILKAGMGAWLVYKVKEVQRYHPEIEILEVNTDQDHIHILASIAPKTSVSHVVNILKTNTARAMRLKFPFLDNIYERKDIGIWSTGYFVSTVGVNEDTIRRYIEMQGREDSGQAKLAL
jgi:putative transposase